jgi:hypothetical protein
MVSFGLPVKASQPAHGVAGWLKSLTGPKVTSQLARQLQSIRQSNKGVKDLIKQATKIISENNNNFHFANTATQSAIHKILLIKWNQYKTGNSMSAVPPVKTNKYSVSLSIQAQLQNDRNGNSLLRGMINGSYCGTLLKTSFNGMKIQIIPLINKISIGAP